MFISREEEMLNFAKNLARYNELQALSFFAPLAGTEIRNENEWEEVNYINRPLVLM